MSNVVYWLSVSLDGFVETSDGEARLDGAPISHGTSNRVLPPSQ